MNFVSIDSFQFRCWIKKNTLTYAPQFSTYLQSMESRKKTPVCMQLQLYQLFQFADSPSAPLKISKVWFVWIVTNWCWSWIGFHVVSLLDIKMRPQRSVKMKNYFNSESCTWESVKSVGIPCKYSTMSEWINRSQKLCPSFVHFNSNARVKACCRMFKIFQCVQWTSGIRKRRRKLTLLFWK